MVPPDFCTVPPGTVEEAVHDQIDSCIPQVALSEILYIDKAIVDTRYIPAFRRLEYHKAYRQQCDKAGPIGLARGVSHAAVYAAVQHNHNGVSVAHLRIKDKGANPR